MASGMMYVRLAGLVTLFNRNLIAALGLPFLVLAATALRGGLVLDALARREDRNRGPRIRAQESARTARRPALRRALCGDAGSYAPGGDLSRTSGRLFSGRRDGRHRRGPVHHGHDAGGRHHALR